MIANLSDIKKLREETGAGVMEVKRALEEAGDYEGAKKVLVEIGAQKAEKKSERSVKDGLVISYIHATGKIGSLIEVNCETDFVAKTDDFKKLCTELALQAAAMPFESVEELLAQEYIRDGSKKLSDLVTAVIAKTGENVKVAKAVRFKVGE